MKKYTTILFLLLSVGLSAQRSTNLPLNDDGHRIYDRLEILNGDMRNNHASLKPMTRKAVRQYADSIVSESYWQKNKRRAFEYQYLKNDHNDEDTSVHSNRTFMKFLYPRKNKSFLRHFYKTPAHLLEFRTSKFYVNINHIIHFKGAYERFNGSDNLVFYNRRGLKIRGNIAEKVYFYTDIIETQADYPQYVQQRIIDDFAVPGGGYFKQYDSNLSAAKDTAGVDYLLAEGYISVDLLKNHIGLQLGHGRHFIGDGHRSLFLSDYSTNYFYLKLNTRVWKINYQNIFAQLTQNYGQKYRAFDLALPKKYLAAHHLSINILKNLNIGLFEGIVFSRGGQFDIQYLNPIIFYRAVEQAVGSPDNVVVGLNWKWNFLKSCSFYGQFLLDELSVGDLIDKGYGWWANKFALQAGFKYINAFGVDYLDLQAEFNMARPYMYTFRDSSANYNHYNQPLAHPLGANFFEWIAILNYQPMPGMNIRAQLNYAIVGRDSATSNWGSNPSISYLTRMQENNNFVGQGLRSNLLILQLMWSYQLRHNMYVDLHLMYRQDDSVLDQLDNNSLMIGLGLRWNISEKQLDW